MIVLAALIGFLCVSTVKANFTRSSDAARIRDPRDPAGIIRHMIATGTETYRTQNGVTVTLRGPDKIAMAGFVQQEQSFRGDWFIWNRITAFPGTGSETVVTFA